MDIKIITFKAYDKVNQEVFTNKTFEEIHQRLFIICSTYVPMEIMQVGVKEHLPLNNLTNFLQNDRL